MPVGCCLSLTKIENQVYEKTIGNKIILISQYLAMTMLIRIYQKNHALDPRFVIFCCCFVPAYLSNIFRNSLNLLITHVNQTTACSNQRTLFMGILTTGVIDIKASLLVVDDYHYVCILTQQTLLYNIAYFTYLVYVADRTNQQRSSLCATQLADWKHRQSTSVIRMPRKHHFDWCWYICCASRYFYPGIHSKQNTDVAFQFVIYMYMTDI